LAVQGLQVSADSVHVTHYRIDDRHSNAYTAWRDMGSPQSPTPDQRAALQKASELAKLDEPKSVESRDGSLILRLLMPRQSVSLIRLDW
jgi:xylan 1,4-beta-xylosidase